MINDEPFNGAGGSLFAEVPDPIVVDEHKTEAGQMIFSFSANSADASNRTDFLPV